jgi:FAD synthase
MPKQEVDKLVGKRVKVVGYFDGLQHGHLNRVGLINRVRRDAVEDPFNVLVVFFKPAGWLYFNTTELRYLNNKEVIL